MAELATLVAAPASTSGPVATASSDDEATTSDTGSVFSNLLAVLTGVSSPTGSSAAQSDAELDSGPVVETPSDPSATLLNQLAALVPMPAIVPAANCAVLDTAPTTVTVAVASTTATVAVASTTATGAVASTQGTQFKSSSVALTEPVTTTRNGNDREADVGVPTDSLDWRAPATETTPSVSVGDIVRNELPNRSSGEAIRDGDSPLTGTALAHGPTPVPTPTPLPQRTTSDESNDDDPPSSQKPLPSLARLDSETAQSMPAALDASSGNPTPSASAPAHTQIHANAPAVVVTVVDRLPAAEPTRSIESPKGAALTETVDPIWQQVVSVVRPVRRFGDGSHRLSIQLHPEELGAVTVELSMSKGQLSLHLVAERQSTADLLSASMHEIRADIDRDRAQGWLDVAKQFGERRPRRDDLHEGSPPTVTDRLPPAAQTTTVVDGRIDLRM